MPTATEELEGLLVDLERVWQPFARPDQEWSSDEGLSALLDARDRALAQAAPLLEQVQGNWKTWEASRPADKERARVFALRNRLVNLALEASRFENSVESGVKRRIEEARRQAADSDKRSRAARAYGSMSLR
jgi:hypothetical protein